MADKVIAMAILGILVALAFAGPAFAASGGALTDSEKGCIRGCCESVGGTYDYEHNGCESPQADMLECADACREREDRSCPLASALLIGSIGAAIACSWKSNS